MKTQITSPVFSATLRKDVFPLKYTGFTNLYIYEKDFTLESLKNVNNLTSLSAFI